MEVPCCGGLVQAAQLALARSGAALPIHVQIASIAGALAER
jgi:hypothetical protein